MSFSRKTQTNISAHKIQLSTSSRKIKPSIGGNPLAFTINPTEENPSTITLHDPPRNMEKLKILKSQMLIPFSIMNQTMDFLDPYLTSKTQYYRVNDYFPCYINTMHVAFEQRALDLKFLEPSERVFHSTPTPSKEYIACLDKVQEIQQGQREISGMSKII